MSTSPTALIVGASRGLGLAMAEEYLKHNWRVIATARATSGTLLHELAARTQGLLEVETIDIAEPDQIAALRQRLVGRQLDLLFVNAGVYSDRERTIGKVTTEEFVRLMVTRVQTHKSVVLISEL